MNTVHTVPMHRVTFVILGLARDGSDAPMIEQALQSVDGVRLAYLNAGLATAFVAYDPPAVTRATWLPPLSRAASAPRLRFHDEAVHTEELSSEAIIAQAQRAITARRTTTIRRRWDGARRPVLPGLIATLLVTFLLAPGTLPEKLLAAMRGVCALRPSH